MWLFSRKMWGAERQGSRREVVAGATSNTVEVAAGEVLTVEVRVAAETARVSWTFSTEENNIGFEASFRTEPAGQAPPEGDDVQEHEGDATADAGGDNDELEVVPFSRVESQVLPQHGSFTNTGSQGILTLTFDNSFSHYRSKQLTYAISTEKELEVGTLGAGERLQLVRTPFGPAELLRWRTSEDVGTKIAIVSFASGGRGFLNEGSVELVTCPLIRTVFELQRVERCRAQLRRLLAQPPSPDALSRLRDAAASGASRVGSTLSDWGGSARTAVSGAARLAVGTARSVVRGVVRRGSALTRGRQEDDQKAQGGEGGEGGEGGIGAAAPEMREGGKGGEEEPDLEGGIEAGEKPAVATPEKHPREEEGEEEGEEDVARREGGEGEGEEGESGGDEGERVFVDLSRRAHLVSDLWVTRFLRLHNWDADKAAEAIVTTLQWRVLHAQPGRITFADVERVLGIFHCFLAGEDNLNRTVCVVRTTADEPVDSEAKLQALLYALERACAEAQARAQRQQEEGEGGAGEAAGAAGAGAAGEGAAEAKAGGSNAAWGTQDPAQMTLVIDFKNFRRRDMDIGLARTFTKLFQAHYPGTMGLCVVYNTPTTFDVLWRALSPFLSPRLLQRVVLLRGEDNEETLRRLQSLLPPRVLHRVLEEFPNFDRIRAADAHGSPFGAADEHLTPDEVPRALREPAAASTPARAVPPTPFTDREDDGEEGEEEEEEEEEEHEPAGTQVPGGEGQEEVEGEDWL